MRLRQAGRGCPCRDPSPQELVIELGWGVSWRWGSWVDSGRQVVGPQASRHTAPVPRDLPLMLTGHPHQTPTPTRTLPPCWPRGGSGAWGQSGGPAALLLQVRPWVSPLSSWGLCFPFCGVGLP